MATFAEMMRRFEALDVRTLAGEAVSATKDEYMDQQKEQMSAGIYWTGQAIRPPYSRQYATFKRKKGMEAGHVTLDGITRGWKLSMYMEVDENAGNFIIDASKTVNGYSLTGILEKRYTGQIWGLSAPYKANYIPVLFTDLKKRIQNALSR